jgi:uncharacterized damage-inducible protein DinB
VLVDDLTLTTYAAHARYNRWMNEGLYALAAKLTGQERRRDLGAFFKSIHGTLNHLLLADRVWLARFGAIPAVKFKSLAEELYDDFDVLRAERAKTDADLERWIGALTKEQLTTTLRYTNSRGENAHPLWFAVTHLFNHQTHHRGQLTTLFMQLGHDPGLTDMIALLRGEV